MPEADQIGSRADRLAEMAGRIFTAMVAHYSPTQADANASVLAQQAVTMASRLLAACEARAALEETVLDATRAPEPGQDGAMAADRFTYALGKLGWSYEEAARQMGQNPKRIQRIAAGRTPVDRHLAEWLESAVLFFDLNPPPGRRATTHPQETGDGE